MVVRHERSILTSRTGHELLFSHEGDEERNMRDLGQTGDFTGLCWSSSDTAGETGLTQKQRGQLLLQTLQRVTEAHNKHKSAHERRAKGGEREKQKHFSARTCNTLKFTQKLKIV